MAGSFAVRTQKWDILKFLLIFLVVLGHAADYYTEISEEMRSLYLFIYSFHMPVFIFVSGLFAKRTVKEKRTDKIFGYFVMYLALKVIFFVVKTILGLKTGFNLFNEGGLPWFMFALAAYMLITMLLKDFSPKYVLTVSVVLACFAGYDSNIGTFLSLSRIIVFYPFFYLGFSLERKRVEEFCSGKLKKAVSAAILAVTAVVILLMGDRIYWLRSLLTGVNPFHTLGEFGDYGFIIRLIYYVLVTVIGFAVITLIPDRTPFGIAAKFGQRTLSVYAFHYIAFFVLYDKLDCITVFDSLFPKFAGWVIIPLSLLITLLFSLKPFNDLLLKIMNVPMITDKK